MLSPLNYSMVNRSSLELEYNEILDLGKLFDRQVFDPRAVPGLVAWYDARYLQLADNDPVSTWPDLSGNSHDLIQATTSSKPTFKTNFNNLPAVYFDGVDDYMEDPVDANLMGDPPLTVVVNFYNDPSILSGVFVKFQQNGSPFKVWQLKEASGKFQITLVDSGAVEHVATGATVMPAGEVSIAYTISTGLVGNGYLNAALDVTQTLASILPADGVLRVSHSTNGMTKNVRNILLYDRDLSVAELEYLRNV